MLSLNLKRATISSAPSIFYVAKKLVSPLCSICLENLKLNRCSYNVKFFKINRRSLQKQFQPWDEWIERGKNCYKLSVKISFSELWMLFNFEPSYKTLLITLWNSELVELIKLFLCYINSCYYVTWTARFTFKSFLIRKTSY